MPTMMRRTRALAIALGALVLGAVVVALCGWLWLDGPSAARAGMMGIPTATATATGTPPALEPPAAPSNLRIEGTELVWDDNSDNEDGFRLRVSVAGAPAEVVGTVPADTTRAPLPDVTAADPCDPVAFDVVAFNDAGESEPAAAIAIIVTDCDGLPVAASATATVEEIVSPPTGAGPAGGDSAAWPLLAAGFGLALAALGGAALISYLRPGRVRRER